MAVLLHERWEAPDGLTTLCLAGPDGEGARALLEPGSRLVWTFEAGSHFEAMTLYDARMEWEPYTSDHAWDREPYPEAWRNVQRG